MAKTRKQISAESRERRKQENKKLISKYVPLEYHTLCIKMLGDETRLPEALMYYQKLLDGGEDVVGGSSGLSAEEKSLSSLNDEESQTHLSLNHLCSDEKEYLDTKVKHENVDAIKQRLSLGASNKNTGNLLSSMMTFEDFIRLECDRSPGISTRALARMAAKEGFAALNSKTNKPGKKVGTDRVRRIRIALDC